MLLLRRVKTRKKRAFLPSPPKHRNTTMIEKDAIPAARVHTPSQKLAEAAEDRRQTHPTPGATTPEPNRSRNHEPAGINGNTLQV